MFLVVIVRLRESRNVGRDVERAKHADEDEEDLLEEDEDDAD
jgi:hypothetical protein